MVHFKKMESREACLASDELRDYHVWWMDVTYNHVSKFEKCLETAKRELDVQAFLEANPMLLVQHLGGGHGRWAIPQQSLGGMHVTDFVIGHAHSSGRDWVAVELESPCVPIYSKNGDPSRYLNHAVRQIQDWRAWLKLNQNMASRPRSEAGLGLTDIGPEVFGLILIGRRDKLDPKTKLRRRQLKIDANIDVHTYDYLLDIGRDHARARHKMKRNSQT